MVEPVAYEREVEAWRRARLARLNHPAGWLSVVGLYWLADGVNSVGAEPSSTIVLPEPAPARLGSIEVREGRVTAMFPPGSGVTTDGAEATEALLRDDPEGSPSVLAWGNLRMELISRAGSLAVRIRDLEAATRRSIESIPHFPVDPVWRVLARFEPYEPQRRVVFPTVVGPGQEYRVMGRLSFELAGGTLTLEAYQELDETELFIVFGDLTNGKETYGGGRYLYASPPEGDEPVVMDFNRSYNPPCVFTPYATCVLAQPENRLPARIEAGELRLEVPKLAN